MRKVRKPSPKTIPPVRANEGLESAYLQKLDKLIDDMNASLLYWLRAAYKANTPEMAQDDSPASAMRDAMAKLSRRWLRQFDDAAPDLGRWFAMKAADRSDNVLKSILREAGFSVQFKMTAAANDVMHATIGEQVGLIRSIAQQHLSEVQGLVMRSVAAGRDLGTLTKEIEQRYGVTKRRAALIARDQNNKATASMTRVRQEGLGITHAYWIHSHGGKHPRPSHVKAGKDKMIYEVSKGALIDGDYIWPGTLIGCRCTCKAILPTQAIRMGLVPAKTAKAQATEEIAEV